MHIFIKLRCIARCIKLFSSTNSEIRQAIWVVSPEESSLGSLILRLDYSAWLRIESWSLDDLPSLRRL